MSVDDVVTALEQAKRKLTTAKTTGLKGVSVLAKSRDSVGHALGRTGHGSPLITEMSAKERALLAEVMSIDALVRRIDQAIAQARSAGSAADGVGGGDPPRSGRASAPGHAPAP